MSMGSVVVNDQVEVQLARRLAVDLAQELEELFMPMSRVATADHGSFQDVEGSEQASRSIAFVVVGHGPAASVFHGQTGLSSVQCLDLGLLVHAEDQGFVRGVQVKTDYVGELLDKPGIAGELECFDPVRLQAVSVPDTVDRCMADTLRLCHSAGTPMGSVRRLGEPRRVHNGFDLRGIDTLDTRTVRSVFRQAGRTGSLEPIAPQYDRWPGDVHFAGNCIVGVAVCREQTNLSAHYDSVRALPGSNP